MGLELSREFEVYMLDGKLIFDIEVFKSLFIWLPKFVNMLILSFNASKT